ncbi:hypothetical protein PCANC_27960 [Puccinia coronata f. sp. avenae]|uniref:Uncharacterized protein n=1 Tax=Puccinia coronata f. sp. avenae TaxID=200324 RepID=A0A2N5S1M3_9BASI|nr:hypothetical protein PCANC_27960 [Puccinia coronata f. sp. avenae]
MAITHQPLDREVSLFDGQYIPAIEWQTAPQDRLEISVYLNHLLIGEMVPNTNAKTHWPEGEHDPSEYNKDHESGSGNDHELVTSRSRSSNGVRNPLDDRYRPFIKKNQSSRGARLLLMTGLHQPSRGGVLLLMAGPSRSSRGERTPVDNPGRPVIKRRMPPLDDQTALAIERRRPPLDGQSVPVIERSTHSS